jgi:5-hydroxyisourate hydrolase-like protein (transthyretin family)
MFPGYLRIAAVILVLSVLAALPGEAQSTSGQLTGKVLDRSGDPVTGAVVQIRSEATGMVRTAFTDAGGRFTVQELEPGRWTAVARTDDGQLSDSRSFELSLQQTVRLRLEIGEGFTETVRVDADAALRSGPAANCGSVGTWPLLFRWPVMRSWTLRCWTPR